MNGLQFEHLAQINDAAHPLIAPLTRAQLWRGLARRAGSPKEFVIGLDQAAILTNPDGTLTRALTFGNLVIRDRVVFTAATSVRYEIEAAGTVPAATLVTTIEEPAPEQLFVRFAYDVKAVAGAPPREAFYDAFVKQAYEKADLDSIVTIRRLAAENAL